jgi:hypothetical protein
MTPRGGDGVRRPSLAYCAKVNEHDSQALGKESANAGD